MIEIPERQLIIVRGPIGAGKTSASREIVAQHEHVSFIEPEIIKNALDPTRSNEDRREVAIFSAAYTIGQMLLRDMSTVTEVHSRHEWQISRIDSVAREFCLPATVLLKPPLDTCIEWNRQKELPVGVTPADDNRVRDYYENCYSIKGEPIIDPTDMKPSEVAKEIVARALDTIR